MMRVVHKKRGTVYDTVGYGTIQCDRPIADCDLVMIYQDPFSGKYWVRPAAEFDDGRFAEVAPVNADGRGG